MLSNGDPSAETSGAKPAHRDHSAAGAGALEGRLQPAPGSVTSLEAIEALFARQPNKPGAGSVFREFTEQEYRECVEHVRGHPRVTLHGLKDEHLERLTAKPPSIFPQEYTEPLDVAQTIFDQRFASAARGAAATMLKSVTERLPDDSHYVVVPIWRAGLVFAGILNGDTSYWHVGAKRDPITLQSSFYYKSDTPDVDPARTHVLLCDPMIGTANAMMTVLQEALKVYGGKIPQSQIHVLGLFATPEGTARLMANHPDVSMHVGTMDTRLDEHGWIVPNATHQFIGDFGDLVSPHGLGAASVTALSKSGVLDSRSLEALIRRLK